MSKSILTDGRIMGAGEHPNLNYCPGELEIAAGAHEIYLARAAFCPDTIPRDVFDEARYSGKALGRDRRSHRRT